MKFHIDGTSKWDYAVNENHLEMKLKGRPATILRPLAGLKLVINAIRALFGFDYDVQIVERRENSV